jgi:hypothetical protein
MSPEIRPSKQDKLRQMPKPQFLDIPSPFGSGNKPIGFIAKSLVDDAEKIYIWSQNYSDYALGGEKFENYLEEYMTRQYLGNNTDMMLGPAISKSRSNPRTGRVAVLPEKLGNHKKFGLYVEISKRPMFNYREKFAPSESEVKTKLWRNHRLDVYDQTLNKFRSGFPKSLVSPQK